MTVSTTIALISYKPGATPTARAIDFVYLDTVAIGVTHVAAATGVRTTLTRDVHYTLGGNGELASGTITAVGSWPTDDLFIVSRTTERRQKASIVPSEPFPAREVEQQLDRQTLALQEQDETIGDVKTRALQVAPGEVAPPLGAAADRLGRLAVFIDPAGKLTGLAGGNGVVGLGANGRPFIMPLVQVLQTIGTTLFDDGAWVTGSNFSDDGVWG